MKYRLVKNNPILKKFINIKRNIILKEIHKKAI